MRVARWFVDWRNGVVILASVMVAMFSWVIIDGSIKTHSALRTADRAIAASDASARASQAEVQRGIDSRQAATERINALQARIGDLIVEVQMANESAGASAARQEALANQVRQLGGRPVVVQTSTATTRPTPVTTATPTTTTRPPPTTTTKKPTTTTTKKPTTTTTTRRR